ncbi:MAG: hypothetical protein HAW58_06805 [Candidatus Thioglobus sp.]|nr:hypothetical protein [Candidatus Thioglobus sp.]
MGMIKLIIIVLVIWLSFSLLKKFRKTAAVKKSKNQTSAKMLACSVCKTHIPENEAIIQNGKIYCSKACL